MCNVNELHLFRKLFYQITIPLHVGIIKWCINFIYWKQRGFDLQPFFTVLDGPRIRPPAAPGSRPDSWPSRPFFDEMFLGRAPVASTLSAARRAANAAADR